MKSNFAYLKPFSLILTVLILLGACTEKKEKVLGPTDIYFKKYEYKDNSESCKPGYYVVDEVITYMHNTNNIRHASQYICVSITEHDTIRIFDPTFHVPLHIEDSAVCHSIQPYMERFDSIHVATNQGIEAKYGNLPYLYSQLIAR